MRKYFMSHIDFSEIVNMTVYSRQIELAKRKMTKSGILTEKGNPAPSVISSFTKRLARSFIPKLQARMRNRYGGIRAVRNNLKMLCDRKDYYGFFMYITFLYGFLEWQLPDKVALLPAVPDALKWYCMEMLSLFDEFILQENTLRNNKELST